MHIAPFSPGRNQLPLASASGIMRNHSGRDHSSPVRLSRFGLALELSVHHRSFWAQAHKRYDTYPRAKAAWQRSGTIHFGILCEQVPWASAHCSGSIQCLPECSTNPSCHSPRNQINCHWLQPVDEQPHPPLFFRPQAEKNYLHATVSQ